MAKRIAVLDGHSDPSPERYCHALAEPYAQGALSAGHEVERITLAEIEVPSQRSQREWSEGEPSPSIHLSQGAIGRADHLVIIYAQWLGTMPALMKAFFGQAFRPGFAIKPGAMSLRPGLLTGKLARIVITMGMPAWIYRWFFVAHSLRSRERNILKFSGIGPIRGTLIGGVGAIGEAGRKWWLDTLRHLGEAGS